MTSRRFDRATRPVPAAAAGPVPAGPVPAVAERGALTGASGGGLYRTGQALLELQRLRGNRYVRQVVQAKLMLGSPRDRYEREADEVAEQVMRGTPRPETTGTGAMPAPAIQRVPGSATGAADENARDAIRDAIEGARGSGQPLPGRVRSSMEEALRTDFSGVRLHTDDRADQLARSLRARAFTTGQDIFFRRGQYNSSSSSRQVLAHELTHVVQQGGGSSLIQRRMGFEFETTAQVRGTFRDPDDNGRRNLGLFTNDTEFYRPPAPQRWMIVPDTGRMEFVSDPLDTLQQLQAATRQIQEFITSLRGVTRQPDIRRNHRGTWTPPAESRPNYTVHVGHDDNFTADVMPTDWYGQPQVSVGVLTDRVASFLEEGRTAPTLETLREQIPLVNPAMPLPARGIPARIQDIPQLAAWWTPALLGTWMPESALREADDLLRRYASDLPQLQKNKLRGLWALMRAYWKHLTVPTDEYRKSALLAMARTDFHSFYNNLNREAKIAFEAAQGAFVLPTALSKIPGTQITMVRWYESVMRPEAGSTYVSGGNTRPVDLLSANRSQTNADDIISKGPDKSMGQYPLDEGGGQRRAVFELRRVSPGARIPIDLMYDHVLLPIFTLVRSLESRGQ